MFVYYIVKSGDGNVKDVFFLLHTKFQVHGYGMLWAKTYRDLFGMVFAHCNLLERHPAECSLGYQGCPDSPPYIQLAKFYKAVGPKE